MGLAKFWMTPKAAVIRRRTGSKARRRASQESTKVGPASSGDTSGSVLGQFSNGAVPPGEQNKGGQRDAAGPSAAVRQSKAVASPGHESGAAAQPRVPDSPWTEKA